MTKETKNKIQYGKVIAKQVKYDHIDLSKMDTVYTEGPAYFRITKTSAFNSVLAITKLQLDDLKKSLQNKGSEVEYADSLQGMIQAVRELIAIAYVAEGDDNELLQNAETARKVIQQEFTFNMALDMVMSVNLNAKSESPDEIWPKLHDFIESLVGVGLTELFEDATSSLNAKLPKVKE